MSSAFSSGILIKNRTTIEGDFDIDVVAHISDDVSISVSTDLVEKNQTLVGIKYKVNDNFSTSFNLFLQNQRKHGLKINYGPMAKFDIIF